MGSTPGTHHLTVHPHLGWGFGGPRLPCRTTTGTGTECDRVSGTGEQALSSPWPRAAAGPADLPQPRPPPLLTLGQYSP